MGPPGRTSTADRNNTFQLGSAPIQNNFNSGRALRRAFADGTLSSEAEYALMHMAELRRGLIQHPIPSDVRNAITKGDIAPGLRPILLTELYGAPGSMKDSSASYSEGSYVAGISTFGASPSPQAELTVANRESASSVSRAPFAAPATLVVDAPVSPEPANITSDIGTQSHGKSDSHDVSGTLDGILRGHGAGGANLKRKRDETSSLPKGASSVTVRSPVSSSITISAMELFRRFAAESVLSFSSSKPKESPEVPQAQADLETRSESFLRHPGLEITNEKSHPRRSSKDISPPGVSTGRVHSITGARKGDDGPNNATAPNRPMLDDDYEMEDAGKESGTTNDVDDKTDTDISDLASTPVGNGGMKADDGRPYNIWRLASGRAIPTYGALLPTGYQPYIDAERPWVCPIRSCRVLFKTLGGLGGHFNSKHRAAILNDNKDGTLSVTNFRLGTGRLPAIVTTKRPLNPNEPPMPEPSLPGISKLIGEHPSTSGKPSIAPCKTPPLRNSLETKDTILLLPQVADETNSSPCLNDIAIWTWKNVVYPHLKSTPISPIPTKGHVQDLLPLQQRRGIEFNPLTPPYFESRPQDISAFLIQITGSKAPAPCERCQQGKGPFIGCIVISTEAPLNVRRQVTSCANCFYKGSQKNCGGLTNWHRKTYPELLDGSVPVGRTSLQAADKLDSPLQDQSPVLRSRRTLKGPNGFSPASKLIIAKAKNTSSTSEDSDVRSLRQRRSTAQNDPASRDSSALLSTRISDINNDDHLYLPMEDWEIAPGRIRHNSENSLENVAFSAAYLAHGEPVSIGPGVGFHVLVVKPGTSHRFEPIASRLRLCSIAGGKVRVKTVDQEFHLGPNGMFQVKPDTSCVVDNRLYGNATIHVTEMPSEVPSL
ncbi:hypothetical protein SCARD494_06669 [Seiridium cardinale]